MNVNGARSGTGTESIVNANVVGERRHDDLWLRLLLKLS